MLKTTQSSPLPAVIRSPPNRSFKTTKCYKFGELIISTFVLAVYCLLAFIILYFFSAPKRKNNLLQNIQQRNFTIYMIHINITPSFSISKIQHTNYCYISNANNLYTTESIPPLSRPNVRISTKMI